MVEKTWIGVDLDETLARLDPGQAERIGRPVPAMVERVREWLNEGWEVRVFTARATWGTEEVRRIGDWCEKHIGVRLIVTALKDSHMHSLYDDRAIRVERNTGRLLSPEQPRRHG